MKDISPRVSAIEYLGHLAGIVVFRIVRVGSKTVLTNGEVLLEFLFEMSIRF